MEQKLGCEFDSGKIDYTVMIQNYPNKVAITGVPIEIKPKQAKIRAVNGADIVYDYSDD